MKTFKLATLFLFFPSICFGGINVRGSLKFFGSSQFTSSRISTGTAANVSIAVVQSAGTQGQSSTDIISSTFSAPTQAGSLIFVGVASPGGNPTSIIDSAGNAYTLYNTALNGVRTSVYASANTIGGVTWVKAIFGSSNFWALAITEVLGTTQSSGTAITSGGATGSHIETTTMTLSGMNNVSFCSVSLNSGSSPSLSPGNGYTNQVSFPNGSFLQIYSETRITTQDTPCDGELSLTSQQWVAAGQAWR